MSNWSDYEDDLPIYELMTRVQIRLWEQGQRAVGISEENGLMYPIIRGTFTSDGIVRGQKLLKLQDIPRICQTLLWIR